MKKIKLKSELIERLLVDGECDISDCIYEVSQVDGLFVRFDEGSVLKKVDAPEKRCVGRPSRVVIRGNLKEGIFVDKAHKLLVGDVIESKDGRKVEVLRVEVKRAKDISDGEWHSMGCDWSMESLAEKSKGFHLSQNGFGMNDEVGLYWYREL